MVKSPDGILYTRNGGFHVTPTGQLVTGQGHAVMGEQGPIILPNGAVAVSGDGTVSVDGDVVTTLRWPSSRRMPVCARWEMHCTAAPTGSALPAANSSLRQGMIEDSNVSPVKAWST